MTAPYYFWAIVSGFLLGVFVQSFLSLRWAAIGFLVLVGKGCAVSMTMLHAFYARATVNVL